MSRRIVGPFNRVEGDLEIKLEIEDETVKSAWVNSPLYRGFERILNGKDPRDALVYTPRICGICSVSQSMAAAEALAEAQGLAAPANGRLMQNIILATENVADHFTHFYLFFMPDFARPVYAGEPWFGDIAARFKAVEGTAAREILPARAAFLHIMGRLAGHWPHTLGLQPGGTTHAIDRAEQARVLAIVAAFRRFLETRTFGDALERVIALKSADELRDWALRPGPAASDFGQFLRLAEALSLDKLGRATDRFLSYGAYRQDGGHLFKRGVHAGGKNAALNVADISEDVGASWYARSGGPRHPSCGITVPNADASDAYSWCKAPRLAGHVVEVGALARQLIDGHPLLRDLVKASGGNVANRVIGRLIEIARVVLAIEDWTRLIVPREAFYIDAEMPAEAEGAGLIEAARGSLGHWLTIRKGRIQNYQIVAPTTWNFSPRDSAGVPGACEQALAGAPVRAGEKDPVAVQHIVRSFDPCMVCTVH
ncbi:nickel-dependent hydrogenase large subunit [Hyphomicrobium denitrificans 1NES1]|uniref:Nickel-dependent hydrogenase large subunit n=1 Tax=Hyphomicrobium denitrificans 1NES1 TaxID=670307 RepID=N0BB58_9HYPH|nr:nickel-dependent hydrogenase large subunit [Hyphomicrobium denitrificans]AGK57355.1 nickel-dependent hydrogenase large subunit [Hyphomicrobium denitrificans 1NES1]